jgi:hypothetical protein
MLAAAIGRRFLSTTARMAGPKLTLYVDTVSPFSYEAYYILRVSTRHTFLDAAMLLNNGLCLNPGWKREDSRFLGRCVDNRLIHSSLQNDPVFKKCEITYIPIFLGGVMKACGNTPPINIRSR